MSPEEFARLANNFYNSKGLPSDVNRIRLDGEFVNYFQANVESVKKNFKVAFCFICLNPLYWEYVKEMVMGAKTFFLPGHQTDYFFWTDIPEKPEEIQNMMTQAMYGMAQQKGIQDPNFAHRVNTAVEGALSVRSIPNVNIIPTASADWPYPTLLRYNLFLQQEEKLKEYDYIFYCDVDMKFVNIVGDEVLSPLTAALHPGYAVRKEYCPPYEPNPDSASFIPRPGKIIEDPNSMSQFKKRFVPFYYAGGFQGGESSRFIEAMKACRKIIDADLAKGYIPIWNDESAWNKYLSENEPSVVLSPAYIYPDSLIREYYIPLWGQDYLPKIKTLTKWFSVSSEGGAQLQKMLQR